MSDGFHCGLRCQGDQFLSGHIVTFYVCFGGHLTGHCACASLGEIFIHITKVSHHVCALFLACPLPWMGHLVVGQEQARSPH